MANNIHSNSIDSFREHVRSLKLETWRHKIYYYLKDCINAKTDREIWLHFDKPDFNDIRPEITRLKQDGLLKEVGKKKCSFTNKTVRLVRSAGIEYEPYSKKQYEMSI